MSAPTDDIAPVAIAERALAALDAARERFDAAGPNRAAVFAPLAEVCWWIAAADEVLARLFGKSEYLPLRNQDEHGRVVAGLRWARNMVGHRQVTVAIRRDGFSFPASFPLSFRPTICWRNADEISRKDHYLRPFYVRYVERHVVSNTLDVARLWLTGRLEVSRPRVQRCQAGDTSLPDA